MADDLCLMVVHAHPDDEAISTGGVLARCGGEGVRTVLVTCTDGRCGDGPGGTKPGDDGHDPEGVVAVRADELAASAATLGVRHLVTLGYHDSGMMGWPTNDDPQAFWQADVAAAAAPLVDLIRQHRPQVVVTYDANGFYGHPDHIMAHRIAMVATAVTGIPQRLYYTAVRRSDLVEFRTVLEAAGLEPPAPSDREEGQYAPPDGDEQPGDEPDWGTPDLLVTTTVDVADHVEAKRASLMAHESQADNVFFRRLSPDVFARLFGAEHFVRAVDRTGGPVPETDLFAGLRPAHGQ
ncbi:MAG TPA: PIG-L family deacetylase [Acidimicrobiales bacterium]|nr:PIG-L family deacetylase [Acidimicrobiales bacterium]